ncbi:MAG: hypothetical protein ABI904_06785 [Chloroflexota bacterium]
MSISEVDILKINDKIAPLIGMKAWGVSLGIGSFVTIEFGKALPSDKVTGRQHGEWHLWIYCSAWRLETEKEVIVGSEDERSILEDAIQQLNGTLLNSVTITRPAFDTIFEFDGLNKIRVFPLSFHDDCEYWMLYTPDGNVLTVGPGTSWRIEKSSKQKDEPN